MTHRRPVFVCGWRSRLSLCSKRRISLYNKKPRSCDGLWSGFGWRVFVLGVFFVVSLLVVVGVVLCLVLEVVLVNKSQPNFIKRGKKIVIELYFCSLFVCLVLWVVISRVLVNLNLIIIKKILFVSLFRVDCFFSFFVLFCLMLQVVKLDVYYFLFVLSCVVSRQSWCPCNSEQNNHH